MIDYPPTVYYLDKPLLEERIIIDIHQDAVQTKEDSPLTTIGRIVPCGG